MSSDIPLTFEVNTNLPEENEILEYAEKHLNEYSDTRVQALSEFRDLIFERGECTPHRTDDNFLLRFLRARRFVIRHAHKLLVHYYTFKQNYPQLFENISVDRWQYLCSLNIVSVLPLFEKNGRRICVYRLSLWDPDQISSEELIKYAFLMLEMYLMDQKAFILGCIGIFDLDGITFKHMMQATPKLVSQMSSILWSFPLRGHQFHVVNQASVFTAGYALAKPFLNAEMKGKLFIHGSNMESLHEHIEPKYLPERYGGCQPDFDCSDWVKHIKSNEQMLNELDLEGYDLKKQLDAKNNQE